MAVCRRIEEDLGKETENDQEEGYNRDELRVERGATY